MSHPAAGSRDGAHRSRFNRSSKRRMLALALSLAACLTLGAPASALTGKGTWNHLGTNGSNGPALNGRVSEMYAKAGTMYVGGAFTNAGGVAAADRIAKWDGNSWSAVGPTIADNGSVFAIARHGGKVYAGGSFINADDDPAADHLAVFDGVSWEPFCNTGGVPAFGGDVRALQIIDSTLFIGGSFQNANGIAAADYLVACDLNSGEMRTTVADPNNNFSGPVNDLAATSNGKLYAGGAFINLGQGSADNVASYKNGVWSSLGSTSIRGTVHDLHAIGMDLYISSVGMNIGGNGRSDHLVKWNGNAYRPVGGNRTGKNGYFPANATINELTTSGSLLFTAGTWRNASGAPTGDMIAFFDGSTWRPLGSNGAAPPNGALNKETEALAVLGGQVYAGGASTNAGGVPKADYAASRSLPLLDAATSGP